MRKLSLIYFSMAWLVACQGPDTRSAQAGSLLKGIDSGSLTSVEWKEKTVDYGKIPEGQKLDLVYHFTNTGEKPLVIDKVEPGCGCTVAETPKEPIASGKEGVIRGSFDSNGRAGSQHKTIYVYLNAIGPSPQELVFTVEVIKKG